MAPTLTGQPKILSLDQLLALRCEARVQGLTIVHCHGCFDIVHPGHIRHLEFAARLGDVLLVSVTGDEHVAKGTGRPLIPDSLRAENLAALDCVDWVHIDGSATAVELLKRIEPDIYIKGREYENNRDPRFLAEREAVESAGGRVVFSSGEVVFSSTALIESMANEVDPFGRRLCQLSESHDLRPSTLESIVARFTDMRIVVIGEAILDRYILCRRPEVASEGPIMTLTPTDERAFDGGAAIVCQHLAALGARAELVTALPENEPAARQMLDRLRARGVAVRAVACDEPLIVKDRYLVGRQKVMKIDHGRTLTLDERRRSALVELADDAVTNALGDDARPADAVILCDYGLGLLTPATLDRLIRRLRPKAPIMSGDVSGRRSNLLRMRSLDLLCPSETELRDAMSDYAEGLNAVVWKWLAATGVRQALVTLGEDGVVAFSRLSGLAPRRDEEWRQRLSSEHVPSLTASVVDELGCGDALLATATLSMACGAELVQATYLGSLAAALEAREIGNVAIGAAALRREWQRLAARNLSLATAAV